MSEGLNLQAHLVICAHRVRLTEILQGNDELTGWIKEAYEGAG
jgi:hypothetical protein